MQVKNSLLDTLPEVHRSALLCKSELLALEYQEVLFEEGRPMDFLWFPTSAVLSLMTIMADGQAIEVTTVGNEGVLGLAGFFGGESIARGVVQLAGDAYRMSIPDFKQLVESNAYVRRAMDAFTHLFLFQIVKTAGCNALHSVEARCARWLLTMDERRGDCTGQYEMTQEFLAEILGCRRQTVTSIAHKLQKAGTIDYRYGIMKLVNRSALQAIACECYHKINAEHNRIEALARQAA